MSRPVVAGEPMPLNGFVRQAIERIVRNGNAYDVCLCEIPCRKEKCMAWVPEKKESLLKDPDCPGAMENPFNEITTGGYCSLIKNGGK